MAENMRTTHCTRLTAEVTNALAAEAEQGYDLSQATVRRMGRPSLEKGSLRVSFRLTPSMYRAALEGRAMSCLARDAFERYIQR